MKTILSALILCGVASSQTPSSPALADRNQQFRRYIRDTYPGAFVPVAAGTGFGYAIRDLRGKHMHRAAPTESFEHHLFDRTLRNSIERGFAIAINQDDSIRACLDCPDRKSRFKHALLGVLLIDGYHGPRALAYPRLINALGTGYIEHEFHPWTPDAVHPMQRAGTIAGWYLVKSFYVEFGREPVQHLKEKARAIFRK